MLVILRYIGNVGLASMRYSPPFRPNSFQFPFPDRARPCGNVRPAPSRNERNFIMARTSTTAEPNTPAFQAWHDTSNGDDSFWIKVGDAWPHRDGKGLSLIPSVIPMNGQMVLRQPLPKQ
jgi:hypothetical protein